MRRGWHGARIKQEISMKCTIMYDKGESAFYRRIFAVVSYGLNIFRIPAPLRTGKSRRSFR